MKKDEIINSLIEHYNFSSYLEIGIGSGGCFPKINCEDKTGVDPNPIFRSSDVFIIDSDSFFETIDTEDRYDLIFIDGLHLEEQVDRDIQNSLNHLSDDGLIVLHDCNPTSVHDIREDYYDWDTPVGRHWNGTVYRSVVKLQCNNPDVYFYTVDTDEGCGVINPRKSQELFKTVFCEDLLNSFELFFLHKKDLLNLISIGEFKEKMNEI
jgi:hypothetical protein